MYTISLQYTGKFIERLQYNKLYARSELVTIVPVYTTRAVYNYSVQYT